MGWAWGRRRRSRAPGYARSAEADASLVVRPHPEHLHHPLLPQDLIDEPVLNRDPARQGAGQVSDEFFETRRLSVRVSAEKLQQSFGLRSKAGAIQLASVLLSLLGEDDAPVRVRRYQPGFSEHLEIGVRNPRRIDSLMRGIDSRWSVS